MRIIPGFLLFSLASAAITAERVDSLPEVLAQHRTAMGEPLRSVQIELEIEEPSFTVEARYLANRDPAMRIDVYASGERVFSEGLNNGVAWQLPGDAVEPEPVNADGTATLLRGVYNNLYGLHERRDLGYTLRYDGTVTLDNKPYWKVTSLAPDGFKELFFISATSGLIERKEEWAALHPDQDASKSWLITNYYDYRWLGNRRLSFASDKRDGMSDEILAKVKINSVDLNPNLPEAAFSIPAGENFPSD